MGHYEVHIPCLSQPSLAQPITSMRMNKQIAVNNPIFTVAGLAFWKRRDIAVVRALTSHCCGPGLIGPRPCVTCG